MIPPKIISIKTSDKSIQKIKKPVPITGTDHYSALPPRFHDLLMAPQRTLAGKTLFVCNVPSYASPVTGRNRGRLLAVGFSAMSRRGFSSSAVLPAFTISGSLCVSAEAYSFSSSTVSFVSIVICNLWILS